jgi:excisionase family DNA binding protein
MSGRAMSEELYTVEMAAERLKLHPKTVLRFIRDGRLRATRIGKSYRILRSDLDAFGGGRSPNAAAPVQVPASSTFQGSARKPPRGRPSACRLRSTLGRLGRRPCDWTPPTIPCATI